MAALPCTYKVWLSDHSNSQSAYMVSQTLPLFAIISNLLSELFYLFDYSVMLNIADKKLKEQNNILNLHCYIYSLFIVTKLI